MKTAFLDTNVINECCQFGINGQDLNKILLTNNFIPVLGIYPTYEIARNIVTNNPNKASQLFTIVRDLFPEFSCLRENLYAMEIQKLKNDTYVDYRVTPSDKALLLKRINEYSDGDFDSFHEDFITIRQTDLSQKRTQWQPVKDKKIYAKYKQNFENFISDFFINFKNNPEKIDFIRNLIAQNTLQKFILTNIEIFKFIDNKKAYPALRSLIYTHLYLDFLTETNRKTPSEDRFTDALIMIEASYCTTFLSCDNNFIKKHAPNLNPHIEIIDFKKLLN